MTQEQAEKMVQNYCEYYTKAEEYYKEATGDKYADIRLNENGDILHEVNEACNCHPEYHWNVWATSYQFVEWLTKQK
jgi:hypothetical protein